MLQSKCIHTITLLFFTLQPLSPVWVYNLYCVRAVSLQHRLNHNELPTIKYSSRLQTHVTFKFSLLSNIAILSRDSELYICESAFKSVYRKGLQINVFYRYFNLVLISSYSGSFHVKKRIEKVNFP